ncbi:unnamed protein product [Calicophoron daubneyi]|uniref:EF-hand domain-containing protein n=1 Tax=Calicophoron daubneyi TaxID=300641 RepID=A0AAV2T6S0_CALDB
MEDFLNTFLEIDKDDTGKISWADVENYAKTHHLSKGTLAEWKAKFDPRNIGTINVESVREKLGLDSGNLKKRRQQIKGLRSKVGGFLGRMTRPFGAVKVEGEGSKTPSSREFKISITGDDSEKLADFLTIFFALDKDGKGVVPFADIEKQAKQDNYDAKIIAGWKAKFDPEDTGSIALDKVYSIMGIQPQGTSQIQEPGFVMKVVGQPSEQHEVQKLSMRTPVSSLKHPGEFLSLFFSLDKHGDGKIPVKEMDTYATEHNLDKHLISDWKSTFDPGNTGTITLDSVCEKLGLDEEAVKQSILEGGFEIPELGFVMKTSGGYSAPHVTEKLGIKIPDEKHSEYAEFLNTFFTLDKDQTGTVPFDHIEKYVTEHHLDPKLITEWKTEFDPRGKGVVTLEDVCEKLGLDPETVKRRRLAGELHIPDLGFTLKGVGPYQRPHLVLQLKADVPHEKRPMMAQFLCAFFDLDQDRKGTVKFTDIEKYAKEHQFDPKFIPEWKTEFDPDNSGVVTLEQVCKRLGLNPDSIKQRRTEGTLEIPELGFTLHDYGEHAPPPLLQTLGIRVPADKHQSVDEFLNTFITLDKGKTGTIPFKDIENYAKEHHMDPHLVTDWEKEFDPARTGTIDLDKVCKVLGVKPEKLPTGPEEVEVSEMRTVSAAMIPPGFGQPHLEMKAPTVVNVKVPEEKRPATAELLNTFFTLDKDQTGTVPFDQIEKYVTEHHLDPKLVTEWRSEVDPRHTGDVTLDKICEILGVNPETIIPDEKHSEYAEFLNTFFTLDKDQTGTVPFDHIEKYVTEHHLDPKLITEWKTEFDPRGKGVVTLEDVCEKLGLDPETVKRRRLAGELHIPDLGFTLKGVGPYQRPHLVLQLKADVPHEKRPMMAQFLCAFFDLDQDRKGTVKFTDIEKYAKEHQFDPKFIPEWKTEFDPDNSGVVTLEQVCKRLGLNPDSIKQRRTEGTLEIPELGFTLHDYGEHAPPPLLQTLGIRVPADKHQSVDEFLNTFITLDKGKTGTIPFKDIENYAKEHHMDPHLVTDWEKEFDPARTGTIDLDKVCKVLGVKPEKLPTGPEEVEVSEMRTVSAAMIPPGFGQPHLEMKAPTVVNVKVPEEKRPATAELLNTFFTLDKDQTGTVPFDQIEKYVTEHHLDPKLVTEWRSEVDPRHTGDVTLDKICEILGVNPETIKRDRSEGELDIPELGFQLKGVGKHQRPHLTTKLGTRIPDEKHSEYAEFLNTFFTLDKDQTGTVPFDHIEKYVTEHHLDPKLITEWKTEFDPRGKGVVTLEDVCEKLGLDPETVVPHEKRPMMAQFLCAFFDLDQDRKGTVKFTDIEKYAKEHQFDPKFIPEWKTEFDPDNSGVVTLEQVCKRLGLNPDSIKQRRTEGTLEIPELGFTLHDYGEHAPPPLLQTLGIRVPADKHQSVDEFLNTFITLDKGKTGTIPFKDIENYAKEHHMDPHLVTDWEKEFDPARTGTIDLDKVCKVLGVKPEKLPTGPEEVEVSEMRTVSAAMIPPGFGQPHLEMKAPTVVNVKVPEEKRPATAELLNTFFTLDKDQTGTVPFDQIEKYVTEHHLDPKLITEWRSEVDPRHTGDVTLDKICEILGVNPETIKRDRSEGELDIPELGFQLKGVGKHQRPHLTTKLGTRIPDEKHSEYAEFLNTFFTLDKDQTGTVPFDHIEKYVTEHHLDPKLVTEWKKEFDPRGKGVVTLEDVCEKLGLDPETVKRRRLAGELHIPELGFMLRGFGRHQKVDLFTSLDRSLSPEKQPKVAEFLRIFFTLDKDKNGTVPFDEIEKYAKDHHLNPKLVEEWRADFDPDHKGVVTLDNICAHLGLEPETMKHAELEGGLGIPELCFSLRKVGDRVLPHLTERIGKHIHHKSRPKVAEFLYTFFTLDKDKNGTVPFDEIEKYAKDHHLNPKLVEEWRADFDPDHKGVVTLDNICAHLGLEPETIKERLDLGQVDIPGLGFYINTVGGKSVPHIPEKLGEDIPSVDRPKMAKALNTFFALDGDKFETHPFTEIADYAAKHNLDPSLVAEWEKDFDRDHKGALDLDMICKKLGLHPETVQRRHLEGALEIPEIGYRPEGAGEEGEEYETGLEEELPIEEVEVSQIRAVGAARGPGVPAARKTGMAGMVDVQGRARDVHIVKSRLKSDEEGEVINEIRRLTGGRSQFDQMRVSQQIKEFLDKRFGGKWQVIIIRGSYWMTYSYRSDHVLHFYSDNYGYLLWRPAN